MGRPGPPPKNVFEHISLYGDDEWFVPPVDEGDPAFQPSNEVPGTVGKLDEMRRRIELGQPLFGSGDRQHYGDGNDE